MRDNYWRSIEAQSLSIPDGVEWVIRTLVADALSELGSEFREDYWETSSPTEEAIYDRLADRLAKKAGDLRRGRA